MRFLNKTIGTLISSLIIFISLMSGCFSERSNDLPEVTVLSVKQIYPTAHELAFSWDPEAVLMQVRLQAIVDGYLEEFDTISFRFEVPGKNDVYLVIECSEYGCSETEQPVTMVGENIFQLYEMGFDPIIVQEIKIDSTDAVNIAIEERNLDLNEAPVRINIVLTRDEDLKLFWYIVYYSPNDYAVTLVDPISGETFDGN